MLRPGLALCTLALPFLVAPAACGSGSSTSPDAGDDGVAEVTVGPHPDEFCLDCLEITVGESRRLAAVVLDGRGGPLDVPVTWSSADTAVATVSTDALVTAVSPGEVDITATAGGVSGSATIRVVARPVTRIVVDPPDAFLAEPGGEVVFGATAYDDLDAEVPDAVFSWTSANPLVTTVGDGGIATGVGPGAAAVLVTSDRGGEGWAKLTVVSPIPPQPGLALEAVSVGITHGCGVGEGGAAWCWGWNFFGQLGDGNRGDDVERFPTPRPVSGDHDFAQVAPGSYHTCAVDQSDAAWCWGVNDGGQLGQSDPEIGGTLIPHAVEGALAFTAITGGYSHSCALTAAGAAYCFGQGGYGALGIGDSTDRPVPAAVVGGHVFSRIHAGMESTCALDADGQAWCWGTASFGQLGEGSLGEQHVRTAPTGVSGDHTFTQLDLTASHVCAVTADGATWCWGRNELGQLGDGTTEARATPVRVDTDVRFVKVTVGGFFSCGLTAGGEVWCWGDNESGQLGNLDREPSTVPVKVAGALVFADIDAGGFATCGVTTDGQGYCWGSAFYGELGSGFGGDTAFTIAPWPITAPVAP